MSNYLDESGVSYLWDRTKTIVDDHYVTAGRKPGTTAGTKSTAEGNINIASGACSHAEGSRTSATNDFAHSEGYETQAKGENSHAEGYNTIAEGENSHAEGYFTHAVERDSHAEGSFNNAIELRSHAEGYNTNALGVNSHVEGELTATYGTSSHSEGKGDTKGRVSLIYQGHHNDYTLDYGELEVGDILTIEENPEQMSSVVSINGTTVSLSNLLESEYLDNIKVIQGVAYAYGTHVEGYGNNALGYFSHVEGSHNVSTNEFSHVAGKYNSYNINSYNDYVEIIGNGTDESHRSNARTLDWNGNETLAGKLTVGAGPVNNMDVATKQYVDGYDIVVVPSSVAQAAQQFINALITGANSSSVGYWLTDATSITTTNVLLSAFSATTRTIVVGNNSYAVSNITNSANGVTQASIIITIGDEEYDSSNPPQIVRINSYQYDIMLIHDFGAMCKRDTIGLPYSSVSDAKKVLKVANNGAPAWSENEFYIETTYSNLVSLANQSQLIPGMQYRITDYETIITGSYDLSTIGAQGYLHNAGVPDSHPFDLIVVADDESHLNENARAAIHSGDTYFANSNLGGWKLKYSLDNDTAKYAWANANGKGVIWWMEDEYNNRAGFDFKNIKFLRYALKLADAQADYTPVDTGFVYGASTQPNRYGGMYQVFMALQTYIDSGQYVNPYSINPDGTTKSHWDYDFAVGGNILGAIQFAEPNAMYLSTFDADWYYTFDYWDTTEGEHIDLSLNSLSQCPCRENYIEMEFDGVAVLMSGVFNLYGLGSNVWEENSVFTAMLSSLSWNSCCENHLRVSCYFNTFGNDCYNNTFGNNCYSNTFGNDCYNNTLGNDCYNNTFGNNCYSNTFSDICYSNTFGNECYSNTFGNNCYSNTFGVGCTRNTFSGNCYRNTFGNNCYSNTFGNECYSNIFGMGCTSNTFGYDCEDNTFGDICECNIFGDKCYGNILGEFCGGNTFDYYCDYNTFGMECTNNTFKNSCGDNTFGDQCDSNTFGMGCTGNTFGTFCCNNTFGKQCSSNTLGTYDQDNVLQGNARNLGATNSVNGVTLTDAEIGIDTYTVKHLETYDGLEGHATLIVKTAHNSETVKTTTDGTTWS